MISLNKVAIVTGSSRGISEAIAKEFAKAECKIPMHRIGEPYETSKVALFLASEAASYITGTTIFVDGGLTLVS